MKKSECFNGIIDKNMKKVNEKDEFKDELLNLLVGTLDGKKHIEKDKNDTMDFLILCQECIDTYFDKTHLRREDNNKNDNTDDIVSENENDFILKRNNSENYTLKPENQENINKRIEDMQKLNSYNQDCTKNIDKTYNQESQISTSSCLVENLDLDEKIINLDKQTENNNKFIPSENIELKHMTLVEPDKKEFIENDVYLNTAYNKNEDKQSADQANENYVSDKFIIEDNEDCQFKNREKFERVSKDPIPQKLTRKNQFGTEIADTSIIFHTNDVMNSELKKNQMNNVNDQILIEENLNSPENHNSVNEIDKNISEYENKNVEMAEQIEIFIDEKLKKNQKQNHHGQISSSTASIQNIVQSLQRTFSSSSLSNYSKLKNKVFNPKTDYILEASPKNENFLRSSSTNHEKGIKRTINLASLNSTIVKSACELRTNQIVQSNENVKLRKLSNWIDPIIQNDRQIGEENKILNEKPQKSKSIALGNLESEKMRNSQQSKNQLISESINGKNIRTIGNNSNAVRRVKKQESNTLAKLIKEFVDAIIKQIVETFKGKNNRRALPRSNSRKVNKKKVLDKSKVSEMQTIQEQSYFRHDDQNNDDDLSNIQRILRSRTHNQFEAGLNLFEKITSPEISNFERQKMLEKAQHDEIVFHQTDDNSISFLGDNRVEFADKNRKKRIYGMFVNKIRTLYENDEKIENQYDENINNDETNYKIKIQNLKSIFEKSHESTLILDETDPESKKVKNLKNIFEKIIKENDKISQKKKMQSYQKHTKDFKKLQKASTRNLKFVQDNFKNQKSDSDQSFVYNQSKMSENLGNEDLTMENMNMITHQPLKGENKENLQIKTLGINTEFDYNSILEDEFSRTGENIFFDKQNTLNNENKIADIQIENIQIDFGVMKDNRVFSTLNSDSKYFTIEKLKQQFDEPVANQLNDMIRDDINAYDSPIQKTNANSNNKSILIDHKSSLNLDNQNTEQLPDAKSLTKMIQDIEECKNDTQDVKTIQNKINNLRKIEIHLDSHSSDSNSERMNHDENLSNEEDNNFRRIPSRIFTLKQLSVLKGRVKQLIEFFEELIRKNKAM